jgi:predicted nucleic acid-binding protein
MTVGVDTNILCYALDPAFKEHKKAKSLIMSIRSKEKVSVNATTIHETYHTLVFKQKWVPEDARTKIIAFIRHPLIAYRSQTKKISLLALKLAVELNLGGRDSLILANLLENDVGKFYTHDKDLLSLKKVAMDYYNLLIEDPIAEKTRRRS